MYVCLYVIVISPLGGLYLIYSNRGRGYCKSDTAQLEVLSTDLFMFSGCIWFLTSLRNSVSKVISCLKFIFVCIKKPQGYNHDITKTAVLYLICSTGGSFDTTL